MNLMDDELEPPSRPLPFDHDAERSVLGACLLRRAAFDDIRDELRVEDFYRDAHRRIFKAIAYLRGRGVEADLITLKDRLLETRELADCGGVSYLATLVEGVPRATNAVHYAGIVRRLAVKRAIVQLAQQALEQASDANTDADTVLDALERGALQLGQQASAERDMETMPELFADFMEHLTAIEEGSLRTGTPTGLGELDVLTSGLAPGLILLAARTSQGKTALALHLAVAAAATGTVAVFSLEMDRTEVRDRLVASTAQINSKALQTQRALSPADWRRVTDAVGTLDPLPIVLHFGPASLSTIRSKARRAAAKAGKAGLALIVVDYLQIVTLPERSRMDTRREELGRLARDLRRLGKELGCPVVALCQLSREAEGRRGGKPQLSDIRESGDLEQDADTVLLLYRPHTYDPKEPHDKAVVHVAKQRQGPTGSVDLRYIAPSLRFEDWDLQEAREQRQRLGLFAGDHR